MKNIISLVGAVAMLVVVLFGAGCASGTKKNVHSQTGPAGTIFSDTSTSWSVGIPVRIENYPMPAYGWDFTQTRQIQQGTKYPAPAPVYYPVGGGQPYMGQPSGNQQGGQQYARPGQYGYR